MNARFSFSRRFSACVFFLTLVVAVWQCAGGVRAQQPGNAKTARTSSSKESRPNGTDAASNNAEYTAKVKEYTTESYFMTELVDHLPASD